jgi:lipopolysaccharide/colanic/teichoic acid biosynthesis glycosyltransferase
VNTLGKEIPMYELRHTVPPGLTGWAQIRYRYGAGKEDAQKKLEYDLYYIRHFSLALELEIIVKTLPMMMKGSR